MLLTLNLLILEKRKTLLYTENKMNCHTFSGAFAKKMSSLSKQITESIFVKVSGRHKAFVSFFNILECWYIFIKSWDFRFLFQGLLRLNFARLMGSIAGLVNSGGNTGTKNPGIICRKSH